MPPEDEIESQQSDEVIPPISFAELFDDGGEETPVTETPVAEVPPVEAKPTQQPVIAENPEGDQTSERLATLERELLIQRTENELLKQHLNKPPTQPEVREQPRTSAKEEEEQFVAEFRANPLQALKKLIEGEVVPKLQQTQQVASQETEQKINLVEQVKSDKDKTLKEYGQLFTTNQDFRIEADRIYKEMGDWRPNAMFLAASTAYSNLVRAGKLSPAKTTPLREVPKAPAGSLLGDRVTKVEESSDPLSEFPLSERARIKDTCKQLNISVDDYMKQFNNQRKADSGYGRR